MRTRPASSLLHPFERGNAAGRLLLLVTGALVVLGTIFVASASEGQSAANGGDVYSIMCRDLAYLCVGVVGLYIAARVRLERLVRGAPALMGFGLVLLVAVKLGGVTANGGKRWLNLHIIDLQPSEMFKLFCVLYLAWLVAHHHDDLSRGRELLVYSAPVWLGCALIGLEPDIGTATVVLAITLATLLVAGLPKGLLIRVSGLVVLAVGGYLAVKPYSARRFFSFLHPNSDLLNSGYQLLQSRIGLGAGGVSGLGLGQSREKWGLLPNPHTDFIFTIVGEELGFVGAVAVIALFVAFLFVAIRIAQRCTNQAYRLVAVGIATWIAFEALVNIASVVGWWAVTGVPLPFFSYGGTALITELVAVGLLYNIAHDTSRTDDLTIGSSPGRTTRPDPRRPDPRRSAPSRHHAPPRARAPHRETPSAPRPRSY